MLPSYETAGQKSSVGHTATRWDKLIDAQKERDLEQVVTEIAEAFEANVKKRPPGRVKTKAEAVWHAARQFLALVLSAGTILREIDGFKDAGTAFANIKSPIDTAMSNLIARKEKAAAAFETHYAVYSKAERREMAVRRHMPQIGMALSKWERIAVALNDPVRSRWRERVAGLRRRRGVWRHRRRCEQGRARAAERDDRTALGRRSIGYQAQRHQRHHQRDGLGDGDAGDASQSWR